MASVSGRHWVNGKGAEQIAASHRFRFLDIGAGIPDCIEPGDLREHAA